jgi:putative nucleotidyltransferase with HDIG domain
VDIKGYDLGPKQLWEHSLATALTAAEVAKHLGVRDPADAFTAGLLHDLGKVVLGNFIDVDLNEIMGLVRSEEVSFDEAERAVLGMDHAEVAAILLHNWKLPQEIVDAVRWHHRPALWEGEDDTLVSIVHLADVLCMDIGFGVGNDGLKYRLDEAVGLKYKMRPEIGEKIMSGVLQDLNDMMQMFSTTGEESSDVSEYTHS